MFARTLGRYPPTAVVGQASNKVRRGRHTKAVRTSAPMAAAPSSSKNGAAAPSSSEAEKESDVPTGAGSSTDVPNGQGALMNPGEFFQPLVSIA